MATNRDVWNPAALRRKPNGYKSLRLESRGPAHPPTFPWAKKSRFTRAFFLEAAIGRLGRKITFWEEGGSLQIAL